MTVVVSVSRRDAGDGATKCAVHLGQGPGARAREICSPAAARFSSGHLRAPNPTPQNLKREILV